MPLKLILGPANSAKAGAVLDAYRAAVPLGALLVVPSSSDASHYDRELSASGTALGRALTFPSLIDEIAGRAGYRERKLTALQRSLVVARAHARHRFTAICESASSPGFAAAAGRLIAELREAGVEPRRFAAALRQWVEATPGADPAYADDLATLYLGYVRAVERTGMVDEQQYAWAALDALRAAPDRWRQAPVFFYGFDDFSATQLDAVRTLSAIVGADVTVALTYEQDREALKGGARVAGELREMATEVESLAALDDHYDATARAALHHLERGIFEPGQARVATGGAVRLIEAGGVLAEAEQVAAEVLKALHAGVGADEIVVIARSPAVSGQLIERTLERYGVPAQSRRSRAVAHTRLGAAVTALARLALADDRDAVPVTELIVYLRAASGQHDLLDGYEAEIRRAGIATVRAALAHPASRALRVEPTGPWLELIGELASRPERARDCVYRLLSPGSDAASARAAAAILTALDEAEQLGGPVGRGELPALLGSLELVTAPTPGAVLVAEPLQIRARRFRRVFVTGLCEGEFPAALSSVHPFLDADQRFQIAHAAGLALPQLQDPLQRERYLLYACVSRATEQVTFSYRTSDEEGNLELPSPFLSDVRALFDESLYADRLRRELSDVTWLPGDAPTEHERQLALAAGAGDRAPDDDRGGPETRSLSAAALSHVRHANVVSAGALVTFAQCPVRWLVDRQLRPEDLDPEADPLARGTYMHTLLERTVRALGQPVTDGNADEAIALLERFADDDHGLAPGRSPQVRAAVKAGVVATLVRYLRETARESTRWQPAKFEVSFGLGLGADGDAVEDVPGGDAMEDASGGDAAGDASGADATSVDGGLPPLRIEDGTEAVLVSGVIDRIDVDRGNPQHAVVIDYKSGTSRAESRRASRWIDDGEIQVALYMLAAERLLGLMPVAGLYQPLTSDDLRPRGVFDAAVNGLGRTVKSDGLEPAQMHELLADAERLAVKLGSRIRRGELTPCPETCSRDGCRYPWICWAS